MRLTHKKIAREEASQIETMTLQAGKFNDVTMATDFSKDIFSVLADGFTCIKSARDTYDTVEKMFVSWKVSDFSEAERIAHDSRSFIKEFSNGEFYQELRRYDPMTGLAIFLNILKKNEQEQSDSEKGDENSQVQNSGESGDEKNGNSSERKTPSKKDMPIDIDESKKTIEKINKIVKSGLLEDKDLQEILSKSAGDEVKDMELSDLNLELIDKISESISMEDMIIFQISRHKEVLDTYKVGSELQKSEFPENEMTISKLQEMSDYVRILPEQLALDDDIFYMKLAQNELLIREYQTRKQRKQAMYLLIDMSGSMRGLPSLFATATALALVKQAVKNEATYFLRFFDSRPRDMLRATNSAEAADVYELLMRKPFSGGGTDIDRVLRAAIKDIQNDSVQFDKSEILLITDGDCPVATTKNDLHGIILNSTMINGKNNDLKNLSKTYEKISVKDIIKDYNLDEDIVEEMQKLSGNPFHGSFGSNI